MDHPYQKPDFKKIKKVLQFVWESPHSSFYRSKYQKAGLRDWKEIQTWADFKTLPLLTKEELVATKPEKRLYFPKDKLIGVTVTSGTADFPLIVPYANLYPKAWKKQLIKQAFFSTRIKRCLLLLSPIQSHARYFRGVIGVVDNAIQVVGDINNLTLSAKIAKSLNIDSIHTTPTTLYYFAPFLKKECPIKKIKTVLLGGEYCSEKKLSLLKTLYPKTSFDFAFASSEGRVHGYRCSHLLKHPPRFFHPMPNFYLYETNNSNQQNELVLTQLFTETDLPLIRYQTGDRVNLNKIKCECGQTLIMENKNRLTTKSLRIQGAFLNQEEITKVLDPLSKQIKDWQIHTYEEVIGDNLFVKLVLQLVVKNGVKPDTLITHVQETVSQNLYLSTTLTLNDLIKKKAFLPLEVETVRQFSGQEGKIISHLI